jgi:hypothetical protein
MNYIHLRHAQPPLLSRLPRRGEGEVSPELHLLKRVEQRILAIVAGGSPAASDFLLRGQKKVTKEKAAPLNRPCGVPCVTRSGGRLRN